MICAPSHPTPRILKWKTNTSQTASRVTPSPVHHPSSPPSIGSNGTRKESTENEFPNRCASPAPPKSSPWDVQLPGTEENNQDIFTQFAKKNRLIRPKPGKSSQEPALHPSKKDAPAQEDAWASSTWPAIPSRPAWSDPVVAPCGENVK